MGLQPHVPGHQVPRLKPDHDPRRRCGGLQPKRGVDRVSGNHAMTGGEITGRNLAGVHADSNDELETEIGAQLRVQRFHGVAHLDRGPHRSQCIVLVEDWNAEHCHHSVADVLLDRAAVALEGPAHGIEVPGLDVAQRLGVEALAEIS
jgi:hypothetical protein